MNSASSMNVGSLLREWRERRSLSQLALACEASISQRHLSFVESGRSTPSRDMIIHLAEQLSIPLRERNSLLVAAGFAPLYSQRPPEDPALGPTSEAVAAILKGHEPYPAIAVDRHWNLLQANAALPFMLTGVDPSLLEGPINVLRIALHPKGLMPRILNHAEWRRHLLHRLDREISNTADPKLVELANELKSYPHGENRARFGVEMPNLGNVAVMLQLSSDFGPLSLISTTTVFGTALDIGLAELTIETFFPADPDTGARLRQIGATQK
ncbi:helix-turn-helix domain-containing protein [Gimibacter soli]|uniref:Helix-turn-helix transcriptional regulator n=1 Tax=Gimibacter soli TaxID=3024400 RepID=A0AAE9XTS9_9PROT|nr:helix-turn-helix transcriptional regulator [Gimibacter soli]WCL53253.1 helix-turn-helix transcriptional regulator [Gimibacter soli]